MVGEALVGTDSVQQARNFNAAFGSGRHLDGFIISKCDTVGGHGRYSGQHGARYRNTCIIFRDGAALQRSEDAECKVGGAAADELNHHIF